MTELKQAATWTVDRIAGVIRALSEEEELPDHLRTAPISGQDTVDTLGLDSLGAVTLIDRLESEVGTPLPDDFLDFDDSVAGIADRLNNLQAGVA